MGYSLGYNDMRVSEDAEACKRAESIATVTFRVWAFREAAFKCLAYVR